MSLACLLLPNTTLSLSLFGPAPKKAGRLAAAGILASISSLVLWGLAAQSGEKLAHSIQDWFCILHSPV